MVVYNQPAATLTAQKGIMCKILIALLPTTYSNKGLGNIMVFRISVFGENEIESKCKRLFC